MGLILTLRLQLVLDYPVTRDLHGLCKQWEKHWKNSCYSFSLTLRPPPLCSFFSFCLSFFLSLFHFLSLSLSLSLLLLSHRYAMELGVSRSPVQMAECPGLA